MNNSELLATLFEQGSHEEVRHHLTQLDVCASGALSVFESLKGRGTHEHGLNFLITYANMTPDPCAMLYKFIEKMWQAEEEMYAANLSVVYVNAGGVNSSAYEASINLAMSMGMHDLCIDLYEKAKRISICNHLNHQTLFNAATSYMVRSRFPEASDVYSLALKRKPNDIHTRMNLTVLARQYGDPRAIELVDELLGDISRSYPESISISVSTDPGYVHDWNDISLATIREALLRHGFCFVRNGCHLDQVQAFHAAVLDYETGLHQFPCPADKIPEPPIEGIYRFDARKLVSDVFGAPGELCYERSVVRRVSPNIKESFVPFHQDSTAFGTALINIWTPLTPAGGEFPSLELVARRVTKAEQTLIQEGEYNLVEISADYVLNRYKGLVYEVGDARPGDCVIFLGTTIHRSSNLSRAVKTRYGLEARWEQSN